MGNTDLIRVDKSLIEVLGNLRREVSMGLKNKYGLKEIEVPQTLSSKIAAARLMGMKTLQVRLTPISKGKARLDLF